MSSHLHPYRLREMPGMMLSILPLDLRSLRPSFLHLDLLQSPLSVPLQLSESFPLTTPSCRILTLGHRKSSSLLVPDRSHPLSSMPPLRRYLSSLSSSKR